MEINLVCYVSSEGCRAGWLAGRHKQFTLNSF